MRRAILVLATASVLLSTGCLAHRDLPTDRGRTAKLAAAKAAFDELKLQPVVDEKDGTVTSAWSWCGDRSAGALVALFPATWARYKAIATDTAVRLEGEAWGANGLLLFGIIPGALVNVPLPFPMEQVEDHITSHLR